MTQAILKKGTVMGTVALIIGTTYCQAFDCLDGISFVEVAADKASFYSVPSNHS